MPPTDNYWYIVASNERVLAHVIRQRMSYPEAEALRAKLVEAENELNDFTVAFLRQIRGIEDRDEMKRIYEQMKADQRPTPYILNRYQFQIEYAYVTYSLCQHPL